MSRAVRIVIPGTSIGLAARGGSTAAPSHPTPIPTLTPAPPTPVASATTTPDTAPAAGQARHIGVTNHRAPTP